VIKTPSFLRKPVLRLLVIGFLFVAAFGLRLYHIGEPPMDFQEVRQYHSALLARGFYEWWLTGDLKTMPPDGIIEPPILEFLASFSYLILGGEHLWIPRLLSALFWMVGGIFLYLIAKRIFSPNAALLSLLFYLFVPFSVLPSRAFMPEPLMIMMLLASILTIVQYHEQPSTRRLIIAATASALALLIKPGFCFFQIFGAYVSLAVHREGIRRSLTSFHFWIFAVLSLLPMGLYYLYGAFIE
jgi:4-amino-4-deoxy-L-arabinose transferase-like glycosyltransferase